jgi:hypothetical protein
MSKSWWDEYPTGKLTTIENFANIVIGIESTKFGSTLSLKSYTIPRGMHSSSMITRSVKSLKKERMRSSSPNRIEEVFSARLIGTTFNAYRYGRNPYKPL